MLKLFPYFLTVIILLFMMPARYESFDPQLNFSLSIIYLFVTVYFLTKQRKVTKNWLRFDVIFLIAYTIVHFQIPFLASIGIEPTRPSFIWINKNVVNFATWMSTMAIVLWMIGYSLIKSKNLKKQKKTFQFKVNYVKYDILLALAFFTFLILVGSSIFKGTYDGGRSWGEGSNYAYLVLRILLYLRIVYFFAQIPSHTPLISIFKKALSNKLFFGVLSVYTLLFLLSGDRGPVMYVALITMGSYALFIKPIPLKNLVVFVLIGAFAFTIIKFGRSRDVQDVSGSNIFERGYASYQENKDDTNLTNELASSVRIQYRALDVVPSQHPYLYGLTFVGNAVGVIPFGGSIFIETFQIPHIYTASSAFFTFIGQGNNPTYGEGSEILSDMYINFGLYGTFLIMLIFGNFSAMVFQRAMNLEFNYVLIFLVLLITAILMNRGLLLTPLKDIVYILFFHFLFTKIIK